MTMQGEELTIRGSLSESSLPELLASISRSKETGILNFHDAGRWKAIYFKEGRIIYAMSNSQDDRLGEFLLKTGKITVRQFLEASKKIQPDKKLGAVLVEQGIITPDDLFVAIHRHAEAIVYSLFAWTRGEYEFVIKDLTADGPMVLDLDSENVILEGIRRLKDFTRMYAGVGPLESVLRPSDNADGLIYKLHLDEDESQVHSLVNGRINVEQILAMSYLPNFETLRILFGLLAAGVVERGGAHESEKRGIELEYELQEVVEQRRPQHLCCILSLLRICSHRVAPFFLIASFDTDDLEGSHSPISTRFRISSRHRGPQLSNSTQGTQHHRA